jgi:hypothetical protein
MSLLVIKYNYTFTSVSICTLCGRELAAESVRIRERERERESESESESELRPARVLRA